MRIGWLAALLLWTIGAAPGHGAPEDGAEAPPGRWYGQGGCAARTGRSGSEAPRRDPEIAWTLSVRGTIEAEPLVWDGLVVLSAREGPSRRSVYLVDLATGQRVTRQVLPATTPLAPAIWNDRIALRTVPNRIDVFSVRAHRLQTHRTIEAKETISEPLLFDDELYVRRDDALARYDLDLREPVWESRLEGVFRGAPVLRGDRVYAAWYDEPGNVRLASLRRADGEAVDDTLLGHHGGEIPDAGVALDLVALDSCVIARLPLPVESTSGRVFPVARVSHADGGFPDQEPATLHAFVFDPVSWGEGWTALDEHAEHGRRWLWAPSVVEDGRVPVLANSEIHARLLEATAPPGSTGDVLFLHDCAVDVATWRIHWRSSHAPLLRPVPFDGGLLVVTAPGTVVALRAPPRPRTASEARARDAVDTMESRIGVGYAALAMKALRTNDAELSRRLLDEALARGVHERTVVRARDGLARLRSTEPALPPDVRRVLAVLEEERGMLARERRGLLRQARESPDDLFRRRIVRALLEQTPAWSDAVDAVRDLVPPEAPRGETFDAESWLDFLDAHAATPVSFVAPPADGERAVGRDAELLAREAREWRGDVSGYRTDRLFVVAPPGRPGAVASALEMGELVCDVLEEMFDAGDGSPADPLALLLYETKDEYIAQSQRSGSHPEIARGWTAGHYAGDEGLSRMFVPEVDDEYEILVDVYAHELTHHWLDRRAPFGPARAGVDAPGYWIAEGFATFVEELSFDLAARTWSAENRRAPSLDVVANARPDQLVPWKRLFALSRDGFGAMSNDADRPIPRTWQLGVLIDRSEIDLFYAQAAAACHFLYGGESGRHRAALLDFVRTWYEADGDGLATHDAFGLTPRELGERIVAFAREHR